MRSKNDTKVVEELIARTKKCPLLKHNSLIHQKVHNSMIQGYFCSVIENLLSINPTFSPLKKHSFSKIQWAPIDIYKIGFYGIKWFETRGIFDSKFG